MIKKNKLIKSSNYKNLINLKNLWKWQKDNKIFRKNKDKWKLFKNKDKWKLFKNKFPKNKIIYHVNLSSIMIHQLKNLKNI